MTPQQIISVLLIAPEIERGIPAMPAGGWGEDWGMDPALAPTIPAGEKVIGRFPGRLLSEQDHRGTYLVLTCLEGGSACTLRVREQYWEDSVDISARMVQVLPTLDEDDQYRLLRESWATLHWQRSSADQKARAECWEQVAKGQLRRRVTKTVVTVPALDEGGAVTKERVYGAAIATIPSLGAAGAVRQRAGRSPSPNTIRIQSAVEPFL